MTARFITAPDKIPVLDVQNTKILIVDTEWHDIEAVALLCMTKQIKVDFYLFGPTSINIEWLEHAAEEADVILINGCDTGRHTEIKTKLSKRVKSMVMGEGNTIKVPMDYLITQLEEA
jgi:hypothetical protein